MDYTSATVQTVKSAVLEQQTTHMAFKKKIKRKKKICVLVTFDTVQYNECYVRKIEGRKKKNTLRPNEMEWLCG